MINYEKISNRSLGGFIWIMGSQFISLIGSQIVSFAVIWYLTIETGSSLILTTSAIANIVPMILISPIAGVVADKVNKNVLLIIADMTQALATLGLIMLFYIGNVQIWHIIALLGVRGLCQGLQLPIATTLPSLMVPEEKLKIINSINQIFTSLLGIASPAIGAIAVAHFQIEEIYWLDVFTFIPTAIVLVLIRIPSVSRKLTQKTEGENQEKEGFGNAFKEGFVYIKASGLWTVFVMFGIANLIVVPVFILLPLLILEHHFGTATQYSIVEVLFQAGLIVGAILLMSSKRKASMKGVMHAGIFLSVVLLALGLIPRGWMWLVYALSLVLGGNLAFIDTQLMSVLQIKIPKEIQGRVFSIMFVIIKSLNPLGLIFWGIIGEYMQIYLIFIIAAGVSLVVYVILVKTTHVLHWGEETSTTESEKDVNIQELETDPSTIDEESTVKTQISSL